MRKLGACVFLVLFLLILPFDNDVAAQATITVSGTVTGPGGPVPDVWVGVGSPNDWQETTTDTGGMYTVTLQTGDWVWFNVHPDLSTRLAQINTSVDPGVGDLTQDFTLVAGHLLSLDVMGDGMNIPGGSIGFQVVPLYASLSGDWWYQLDWREDEQRYEAVLPPDVYFVTADHVPLGYYETHANFDLRTADLSTTLDLNTDYVHPIPYEPPDASRISFSVADSLGEVTVTGAPGAVLPFAKVLLVNLNSAHQAHTVSDSDGSFTARIYAPLGSAVMIKHGPAGWRWQDLDVGVAEMINPFPGTIINLAHTHVGDGDELPFAAVGAINQMIDDVNTTRNTVGAAWSMTGTLGPLVVEGSWTRIISGTYGGVSEPGLYLGGLNWTHPALVDLDGDHDLDLVVGERTGNLVLYHNQGEAAAPAWQFEDAMYADVDTGGWAYPTFIDVTNDGAPDLFVGTGSGLVQIYYNTAGTLLLSEWPAEPDVVLSVGNNAAPALDDLDGDGDLDLVVGHSGSTLYHFENTGSPNAPVWTQRSSTYGGIDETASGEWLQPAFVDLDGDNDRDLLVGLCGQFVWYRREGTALNPSWTRVAADPIGYGGSCAASPSVGDWSGDGAEDLVVGEHWGHLSFFLRTGSTSWASQGFDFPFDLAGDSAPALADWDDDGDFDLLIGQAHGSVEQYTNIGDDTHPDWRYDGALLELEWTNHPHAFPTFADIDGDDDVDLFIGEGGWQGDGAGGNIHYYRNDGTPGAPSWTQVTTQFLGIDVGGWSTPVFVDIDADDDLDLFIGDETGSLTFVQNTGTRTTPAWAPPMTDYGDLDLGDYSAPAFFDVDQDGLLDMLVGHEADSLAYVRNIGTLTNPAWKFVADAHPAITVGDHTVPAVAGDQLYIGDGDGGINLYRYTGPQALTEYRGFYNPGDSLKIQGVIRLQSPAITATSDVDAVSVAGWLCMRMQANAEGHPLATENYFQSTILTPSGFPIQRTQHPAVWMGQHLTIDDFGYVADHTFESEFTIIAQVPEGSPPGDYRPFLNLGFSGVPTNTDWLAANVTYYTTYPNQAVFPRITVADGEEGTLQLATPRRLFWRLLMDDFVQGTRGAGAREDQGVYDIASQIVSQGAPYVTPPVDVRTGQPISYRLEPFLPMISFTDRRMPSPPLIPFALPGGQLNVAVQQPDGTVQDLGSEQFLQSFNRTKTTRAGNDLNSGTVQLEDVYSLKVASDRFRVTFDQYGHHVITMTGVISDIWGNGYVGGGIYDVWVAHPLDIDPGVLPGTPLAVGDSFNPAVQFYPRVPAAVELTLTLYPDSDPTRVMTHTVNGRANRYGAFGALAQTLQLQYPGEYRVDLTAIYTDTAGEIYMGAMTWGGIVMTPPAETSLVAHGRRGLDSLESIPNHWFVSSELDIPEGAVSHSLNPYYNGDIFWSRMSDGDYGGDSLILGASVQDTVGALEDAIETRAFSTYPPLAGPGDLSERFAVGEIPLFINSRNQMPVQMIVGQVADALASDVDQIAYSYRSSQRPGVRVRELVAEDGQSGGYWRLDTLYDDQLAVGVQGDQVNDFKFQYVGAVFRDLDLDINAYVGQGSGWVFIPDSDALGSRVMPPFAGYGGWTAQGGPILTLKGEPIHIFILPTGTRPGAVLEVGDTFHFAGHVMPTLDSRVMFTATAPSGAMMTGGGQANSIGYFYNPDDDFVVTEPGAWSVDVRVWHEGQCSGGTVDCASDPQRPCPSGDVLGSQNGRYWFYVVPSQSPRLQVLSPSPGFLTFENTVTPVVVTGTVPSGLTNVTLDYTISMPGYILMSGQVLPMGDTYEITFDPSALHAQFPNLDLVGRDTWKPGLSDTIMIGLLLSGEDGGTKVFRANTISMQGPQVFVGNAASLVETPYDVYLPLVLRLE